MCVLCYSQLSPVVINLDILREDVTWLGSRSGMASMRKGRAKDASWSGASVVTDSDRYARILSFI
jgi:hypothetical protein